MSAADVDVVVIGGGLAGTSTLRDLARRAARVVLFERDDLAAGGSIAAQGTVDVRDLELEDLGDAASRARRAREESILVRTAPHLASSVRVLALASGPRRGVGLLARWDALLALRARAGEQTDRHVLDPRAARAREAALRLDDDRGALLTTRVRVDARRLSLAYARDAIENGADLRLREEVVSLVAGAEGVRVTTRAGDTLLARAAVIATGAESIPGAADVLPRERRVHLVLGHAIVTHAIVDADASIVPFHNVTIVTGPASARAGPAPSTLATRDEVRTLLSRMARVVPELRDARIDAAYASVRRTLAAAAAPPVFVVPAGTPWDARARAGAIGALVAGHLGLGASRDVESAALPGGEEAVDSFLVAERLAIPEPTARRVALRHGARAIDIGARIGRRRTEASVVCACEPVLEAEIRHAIRAEHARDVCDVGRRTGLGHGACGGMLCAQRAAEIVRAERALAPSDAREMTRRFLAERWVARAPALDGAALAQEELAHARWTASSLASGEDGGGE